MPLAQPSKAPDLQGLGRHLPGFLQETSCSGPSPGQRGTTVEAQTLLSMGLRAELQLTGGEAVPRSSRAARAGPLAARQAAPRNPWEGIRGRAGAGQWGCAGHKHVQSAGCRGSGRTFVGGRNLNLECGWGLRSWLPGGGRQRLPQGTGKG